MGSQTHCYLQRRPWKSHYVRCNIGLSQSRGYLPHIFLPLTLVGARVQVPCPLVSARYPWWKSSGSIPWSVYGTVRLLAAILRTLEVWKGFLKFYRNLAPLGISETLRLNKFCSINSWPTLNALVLLTWLPACVSPHLISWWPLSIKPLTLSHTQVFNLGGKLDGHFVVRDP